VRSGATAYHCENDAHACCAGKGGDKARTAAAATAARREQEDAADFLQFLLDNAHEELLQLGRAHAAQLDAADAAGAAAGRGAHARGAGQVQGRGRVKGEHGG